MTMTRLVPVTGKHDLAKGSYNSNALVGAAFACGLLEFPSTALPSHAQSLRKVHHWHNFEMTKGFPAKR